MQQKRKQLWNLYMPLSRINKIKGSFDKYKVSKTNNDLKDNEKVEYTKLT